MKELRAEHTIGTADLRDQVKDLRAVVEELRTARDPGSRS